MLVEAFESLGSLDIFQVTAYCASFVKCLMLWLGY